jgi:peptide/nickel transport system substrate-binding protein
VANGLVFFGLDQYREELLYSSVKGSNPFKDVRVREALWRAIDVETLKTKVMRGLAAPTGCMAIAEFACLAREAEQRPAFDLKRARKLMADAGYSEGFELTLDCPNDTLLNDVKLCTAVSAMLARIRVAVKLNVMPKSVFLPKINNHDTSFYLYGWGGPVTDAGGLLNGLVRSFDPITQRGGDNHARFIDLELDRLLDAAAVEMDREKRSRMIRDALQGIARERAAGATAEQHRARRLDRNRLKADRGEFIVFGHTTSVQSLGGLRGRLPGCGS